MEAILWLLITGLAILAASFFLYKRPSSSRRLSRTEKTLSFNELTVTMVAYRSRRGKHWINGSRCRIGQPAGKRYGKIAVQLPSKNGKKFIVHRRNPIRIQLRPETIN